MSKLGADYADLRFKFALNVPNNATGTYILDSLRFENPDALPSILLGTTGDQTLQPNVDSLSVFGDSLPLIGRIVDAVGVASASLRINGGSPIAPALDATCMSTTAPAPSRTKPTRV